MVASAAVWLSRQAASKTWLSGARTNSRLLGWAFVRAVAMASLTACGGSMYRTRTTSA